MQTESTPAKSGIDLKRRLPLIAVSLLIAAGFAYLVLRKVDWARLTEALGQLDMRIWSLALCTMVLQLGAMSLRTLSLMRPLAPALNFMTLFRSVLVGIAGNAVLPLRMGEFLRIDYLARRSGLTHSMCLAVVATERVLDVLMMLLLYSTVAVAVVKGEHRTATLIIGAGVALAGIIGILLAAHRPTLVAKIGSAFFRPFSQKAASFVEEKLLLIAGGLEPLQKPARLARLVGTTLLFWSLQICTIGLLIRACGAVVPWYGPPLALALITFGVALPAAPAFVGTFHYFAALALTTLGIDQARATAFALISHASSVLPFTLLAIIVLAFEGKGRKRSAQESD